MCGIHPRSYNWAHHWCTPTHELVHSFHFTSTQEWINQRCCNWTIHQSKMQAPLESVWGEPGTFIVSMVTKLLHCLIWNVMQTDAACVESWYRICNVNKLNMRTMMEDIIYIHITHITKPQLWLYYIIFYQLSYLFITAATSGFSSCKALIQMDEKSRTQYPFAASVYRHAFTAFFLAVLSRSASLPLIVIWTRSLGRPLATMMKLIWQWNNSTSSKQVLTLLIRCTQKKNHSVSSHHLILSIFYINYQKHAYNKFSKCTT